MDLDNVPKMAPPLPDKWMAVFNCRGIKFTMKSKELDQFKALVYMTVLLTETLSETWGIEFEEMGYIG